MENNTMCWQRFLLDNSRDVFLVVVGFAEICGLAIFTRVRGVSCLRCYWLGTGTLKFCFGACNLVRQVHHAGRLSWAFSNAPWPRGIMSGCILEVRFFFEMKQDDFAHCSNVESSVRSCN